MEELIMIIFGVVLMRNLRDWLFEKHTTDWLGFSVAIYAIGTLGLLQLTDRGYLWYATAALYMANAIMAAAAAVAAKTVENKNSATF